MRTCYQVSIRRAAQTLAAPRATLYYRSRKPEQAPLRHRIKEIAATGCAMATDGFTPSCSGRAGE